MNRVKGEGFSLQITTTQDIDALASNAKRAGAALDEERPHGTSNPNSAG